MKNRIWEFNEEVAECYQFRQEMRLIQGLEH
jgi:hypothetical protein